MMSYSTLVADPPWTVKAGPLRSGYAEGFIQHGNGRSLDLQYPTMSVDDIAALPVEALAAPDSHLYLWTINHYIEDAFRVARAWGFEYSTLLTWSKKPMGGGLGGAFGISTEHVLFCRRGSLPRQQRVVGTCFNWKRHYDERGKPKHSAKPPEFMDMVETVSPGPYVELFAREPRDGWDQWGDESLGTAEMPCQPA